MEDVQMRKFLLFRVEKDRSLDLIFVISGKDIGSVSSQIDKEIKRDLQFIPWVKNCCTNAMIGEYTDYEFYVEHKAYGYIYPPYYKTIMVKYLIHEKSLIY